MRSRPFTHVLAGIATAASLAVVAATASAGQQPAALGVAAARVSIDGTSNIHPYSASTNAVRVKAATVAIDTSSADAAALTTPGVLHTFEIAVAAGSLISGKDGLDKNMHKALKVQAHPDITFRLKSLQPASNGLRATGLLAIAGVEREVGFDVAVNVDGANVTVKGAVPLLMTDYGITPPKAMLGMLKTDPKVTVTFDTSFTLVPQAHGTN